MAEAGGANIREKNCILVRIGLCRRGGRCVTRKQQAAPVSIFG